jgi:hypothetical protein
MTRDGWVPDVHAGRTHVGHVSVARHGGGLPFFIELRRSFRSSGVSRM